MPNSFANIFFDGEIASQLLRVISGAKKEFTIVTPYIELWGNAKDALRLAISNGITPTFIVRDEQKVLEDPDLALLLQWPVRVLAVERLHAKIFLNEELTLTGSMNFTEYSTNNSKEIAFEILDREMAQKVRGYVYNTLTRLGRQIPNHTATSRHPGSEPSARKIKVAGTCIRCGNGIALNAEKPFCKDCYDKWAEWENEEYEENFCHSCGKASTTSFAKPLCFSCYRKQ